MDILNNIFCIRYHLALYTMQEPQYLGKITLVLIWFRIVLTQIITHVYRDSLNLDEPIKYQYLTRVWFLYYIGSLIPLLMLTIDNKRSPIYQSNIGVKVMEQRSRTLHLSLNLLYSFVSPFDSQNGSGLLQRLHWVIELHTSIESILLTSPVCHPCSWKQSDVVVYMSILATLIGTNLGFH